MQTDIQRLTRLANIAELYYRDRWTQSRIAKRFGVSTMQISRLLKEAEDAAVVEVRINHPLAADEELGGEIAAAFGLASATVVRVRDSANPQHEVARAAALRLEHFLEPETTLALAWSSTLALMASELPRTKVAGLKVVQMIGALTMARDPSNPYDVISEFGERLHAEVHALHAPTLLHTKEARDALIEDPAVKTVLDRARSADTAIIGIGSADRSSTFFRLGYLSEQEFEELQASGMVGDVLGHLIDANGAPLPWSHADTLVSVSLDELREIPQVVSVAAGQDKVRAILGTLRGGYCSHLITDAETASAVMRLGAGGSADA